MKIEQIDLKKIIPYARNARINAATVSGVAASIKEFGFQNPIIIDKDNIIIAGHTRLKAAQQLGLDKAPCLRAEGLTDEQVKAYRLLDNKLQEKSQWDLELLNLELEELDFDFAPFDVEFPSLEPEQPEVVDDEYEVPDEIEAFIKLGDIIEIGRHRLMCGDSTDAEQVAVLMDGKKADMVFTDPPYGVSRDKGFRGAVGFRGAGGFKEQIKRRVYNDEWDSSRPTVECFELLLKQSNLCIFWGGNFFADLLPSSTHWLVWDKLQTMPTFGDCELAWTNSKRQSIKKYTVQYNGLIGKEKERFHPTQKPVKLFIEVLQDYSVIDNLILDAFLGSGTTMVAAHQLNRTCYGMELEPKYCQVTINRMQKLDESIEIKINGEPFVSG